MTNGDTTHGPQHHGTSAPAGLTGPQPSRGRFGRMFPYLPAARLEDAAIDELVKMMLGIDVHPVENEKIPAGYTYLGQFIDHDISFDPVSQLQRLNDPLALVDYRSPRFDLDSLYGSGPSDQPFLYDWEDTDGPGVKLLINCEPPRCPGEASPDLPRNQQHRALIGDPRNDENAIIAQLHLLFIRFHNAVVDRVRGQGVDLEGMELFREAQRIVRWHYQWIVAHDFLRRVVGNEMMASVFRPGRPQPVRRRFYRWEGEPFIPVEFSGAAYRFGHSMVRDDYTLNRGAAAPVPIFPLLADPNDPDAGLQGFRTLRAAHVIEWALFFDMPTLPRAQASHRIDTKIAHGLSTLPPEVAALPSLPELNLRRGRALGLPSGFDVARAMGETPLTTAELWLEGVPHAIPEPARSALRRSPPLWYYVLCEALARNCGLRLGRVGGRIVAEVLIGLLEADPESYLNQSPTWTPELGDGGDFTMVDLVGFVERPR